MDETEQIALVYTFDNKRVVVGVEALAKAFVNAQKAEDKFTSGAARTEKVQKQQTSWMTARAVALGNIISGVVTRGFHSAYGAMLSNIPALGQAIEGVGIVITRNLFWPLSKAVLPIIIDIFHWVRDNRTAFVQLGTVIANIFKAAIALGKGFLDIVGAGLSSMLTAIGIKGRLTMERFQMVMNWLLLKVVFAIIAVQLLMKGAIEDLGAELGWGLKNMVWPYIKGFYGGFETFLLSTLREAHALLLDLIPSATIGDTNILAGAMAFLGSVIALRVLLPLRLLILGIRLYIGYMKMVYGIIFNVVRWATIGIRALYDFNKALVGALKNADFSKGIGSAIGGAFIEAFKSVGTFIKTEFQKIFSTSSENGLWATIRDTFKKGWETSIQFLKDAWKALFGDTPLPRPNVQGQRAPGGPTGMAPGGPFRPVAFMDDLVPPARPFRSANRSGGPVIVNININGGDLAKVKEVVVKAIAEARSAGDGFSRDAFFHYDMSDGQFFGPEAYGREVPA